MDSYYTKPKVIGAHCHCTAIKKAYMNLPTPTGSYYFAKLMQCIPPICMCKMHICTLAVAALCIRYMHTYISLQSNNSDLAISEM